MGDLSEIPERAAPARFGSPPAEFRRGRPAGADQGWRTSVPGDSLCDPILMNFTTRALVCGAAAAMLTLFAQESKTLHPEMTVAPDAGTYDKPAGSLGSKPGAEWTETTVNAGVAKKPLDGKVLTVAGEIIDLSCYLQLGKHGEKHKPCGVKCLQSGQPIGLLTKDGDIYMLMAEEHDPRRDGQTEGFRKAAIENFAKIVEVTGTETAHTGFRAIYVQGYVAK